MNLSENAIKVLERRYLSKDETGKLLEDPEGMFRRVAKSVAEADAQYVSGIELKEIEREFFDLMANLEFLPEFTDPYECRPAAGAAQRLFCTAGRRYNGGDFRIH